MRLLLLVALFVVVPIAELAIIIQVGSALGLLPTIALLIADSILGSLLMRSQGRATWRRFNTALQTGRVPATEVIDGGLVIFGGACLLTPGFITDAFGLLLLLPPSRALVRRFLVRRFALRMVDTMRRPATVPGEAYDVDGTAHDVAERRLDR